MTPYEVGVLLNPPSMSEPLFYLNLFVDLVFWSDIVVNFNLMCAPPTHSLRLNASRPLLC